jgi:hypothetical protein
MELKYTVVFQATVFAVQGLLVIKKLLSILVDAFFVNGPGH